MSINNDSKVIHNALKTLNRDNIYSVYNINVVGCGCIIEDRIKSEMIDSFSNVNNLNINYYKNTKEFIDVISSSYTINDINSFNVSIFSLNYCKFECKNNNECFIEESNHICKNPFDCIECVCVDEENKNISVKEQITRDINNINSSISYIYEKIKQKNNVEFIISDLDHLTIDYLFNLVAGNKCPISSLKHISTDITDSDLIKRLHNIIVLNSISFQRRWEETLSKLEGLQLKRKK